MKDQFDFINLNYSFIAKIWGYASISNLFFEISVYKFGFS